MIVALLENSLNAHSSDIAWRNVGEVKVGFEITLRARD